MTGKSHLIVGVASAVLADSFTGLVAAHPLPLPALPVNVDRVDAALTWAVVLAAAALGALLPDIDHPESTIAHDVGLARGHGWLTDLVGGGFRALLGGHRGFTHSAVMALLVSLAAAGLRPWLGAAPLGFAAGYVSHIVADMLTKEGVRLWWPITRREVGLGPRWLRFRTGTVWEYLTVGVWVAAAVAAAGRGWFWN